MLTDADCLLFCRLASFLSLPLSPTGSGEWNCPEKIDSEDNSELIGDDLKRIIMMDAKGIKIFLGIVFTICVNDTMVQE